MDYNPNLVNIYLEASDKDELIKMQLMNNMINNKAYNYQTPYKDGKKWVVWFFADPTDTQQVTPEMLKGDQ